MDSPEPSLLEKVADVHRNGGDTGGRGWGYEFSLAKTMQAVLRSQGTALSARTLASGPETPGKYFGIAKCFRYDQVDATHLPDFFQVEGIVLGEDINFRHLLGLLKLFAEEIAGAESYRYVPAYFPFTEPSVEVDVGFALVGGKRVLGGSGDAPDHGWMELLGSGMVNRRVIANCGLDPDVWQGFAFGVGVDRLAMLKYGMDDLRAFFDGDLRWLSHYGFGALSVPTLSGGISA